MKPHTGSAQEMMFALLSRERFKFLFLGAVLLAWWRRFAQDDAYIVFRYAKNFVAGHGFVYNVGERVEGYTTFLWTVLMTLPFRFGMEPKLFSMIAGIAFFFGSLLWVRALARQLFDDEVGFWAIMLLAANFTFSSYATGGLETSLNVFWIMAVTYQSVRMAIRGWASSAQAIVLSISAALSLMTRLDAVLLVGPALLTACFSLGKEKRRLSSWIGLSASLLLPAGVLLGLWFAWKLSFYGQLLPNTAYVKLGFWRYLLFRRGVSYLVMFSVISGLIPTLTYGFWRAWPMIRRTPLEHWIIVTPVLLWIPYVIRAGGDFMEFRMWVPICPHLFILAAKAVTLAGTGFAERALLAGGLVFASMQQAWTHQSNNWRAPESISWLNNNVMTESYGWNLVGKRLGAAFGNNSSVVMATSAAGAIPFYSGLKTIDTMGLNDAWIAKHGDVMADHPPGHGKRAPLSYLLQRDVNLLVSGPKIFRREKLPRNYFRSDVARDYVVSDGPEERLRLTLEQMPEDAKMIEIPLDNPEYLLVVLYLKPHSQVDEVIVKEGWKTVPLSPD